MNGRSLGRGPHHIAWETSTMTPWRRIVTLAAVGCLIAGAALAQQQIRPPSEHAAPSAVALGPAVGPAEGAGS